MAEITKELNISKATTVIESGETGEEVAVKTKSKVLEWITSIGIGAYMLAGISFYAGKCPESVYLK